MSEVELAVVWLSLRTALLSVAASLVPGVLVAWLLARWPFWPPSAALRSSNVSNIHS